MISTYVKGSIGEERYEVKVSRTVLKRGLGSDTHSYFNIMPVIVAALLAFGIVRFVGMGTGNKGLYITGGVCLVTGMALKQLGSVRGARKRLGG